MRSPLYNARTARQIIVDVMVGSRVRDTPTTTQLQQQITAKSLTTFNTATFGFLNNAAGSNQCSVSGTALTSPDLPWTASDVGKDIFVQGAGVAGATLQTTIAAFVSAGAVTLTVAATTAVTETATSAGGIAVWGWTAAITRKELPIQNSSGDNLDTDLYTGQPLGRYLSNDFAVEVPKGPITTSGLTATGDNLLLGRDTAGVGAIQEITLGAGLALTAGVLINTAILTTIAFKARSNVARALTSGVTNMIFEIVDADDSGSGYNNATGIFTVPAGGAGWYAVAACLQPNGAGLDIYVNNALKDNGTNGVSSSAPGNYSNVMKLADGDTVSVRANASQTTGGGSAANYFGMTRFSF